MQFCMAHWSELRAAIDARGLTKFVSQGGAEAARRMAEGGFDPLLHAHNAIVANALEAAGLALMQPGPDGSDPCPLCYLLAACKCRHKGTPECPIAQWVDRAADDQFARAAHLGLIASG